MINLTVLQDNFTTTKPTARSSLTYLRNFIVVLLSGITAGCTGLPEDVNPVDGFDVNKYLGKWYEIARLDHSFERGLDKVSAEYSLRDDGGV